MIVFVTIAVLPYLAIFLIIDPEDPNSLATIIIGEGRDNPPNSIDKSIMILLSSDQIFPPISSVNIAFCT